MFSDLPELEILSEIKTLSEIKNDLVEFETEPLEIQIVSEYEFRLDFRQGSLDFQQVDLYYWQGGLDFRKVWLDFE